jgi:hypothetical protein
MADTATVLRMRRLYVRPSRTVAGMLLTTDDDGMVRSFRTAQEVVGRPE